MSSNAANVEIPNLIGRRVRHDSGYEGIVEGCYVCPSDRAIPRIIVRAIHGGQIYADYITYYSRVE